MFISLQWLKNVACGVFARRNLSSKKRQPKHALARIEGLEDRSMLSASIVIANGSAQVADPGDTVDALHFSLKGSPKITHLTVATTPQSTTALTNLHLFAGTVDVGFEITTQEWKLLKKSGGTVKGTVPENASDGATFQYAVSTFTPLRPKQKISVSGGPASVFTVDAPVQANVLHIEINGPIAGTFDATQNNIVLATLSIGTTDGAVDMANEFFAIEGRHSDNSLITSVDTLTEGMYLRDVVTGQVITTSVVQAYNGLQIYKASDFVVDDGDVFELVARMNGPIANGDRFRVHAVLEPSSSSTMVNIGGLSGLTTDFRLQAVDLDTGNVVDVNPGGVINGNFQTAESAQLSVTQQNIGSSTVAVKNQKNVPLFQFVANASTSQDVLLTQAVFEAKSGSLLNASRYLLLVDTNGDGVPESIVDEAVAQNGQVQFDTLVGGGYVNPHQQNVVYQVCADIASSLTSDTLQLRFATAFDQAIQAEAVSTGSPLSGLDVNGSSPGDQIHLSIGADSVLVHLHSQGNLFVTPAVGTFGFQYVQLGTLDKPIAAFDLRAEGEDVSLTTFTLFVPGHPASIDRLELYDAPDAVTPFATAVKTSGSPFAGYDMYTATLTVGSFVVEDGATEAIYVRPRLRSDVDGGVTNEPISVDLLGAVGTSVTAVGMESSNQLQVNDEDSIAEGEVFIGVDTAGANQNVNGNPSTTVGAEPVAFQSIDPNADGTSIPVGVSRILSVRITAAANVNTQDGLDKVLADRLTSTVFTQNVSIDTTSFRLYNLIDPSVKIAPTTVIEVTPGTYGVQFDELASGILDTRIPSGADTAFALEVNILNPKINNAQTSILYATLSLSNFGFHWIDQDAGGAFEFEGVDAGVPEVIVGTTYLN